MISSPSSPGAKSSVPISLSTMLASVSGKGNPMDPVFRLPRMGFKWVTGEVSVKPNPSMISAPVNSLNCFVNSTGMGADPVTQKRMERRSKSRIFFCCSKALNTAGAEGKMVGLTFSMALSTS